jgi:putative flippase GtrA
MEALIQEARRHAMIVRYLIAGGIAATFNLTALYILTDLIGLYYLVSVAISFIAAYFVSFTLQKFWTFQDKTTHRLRGQAGMYFVTFITNFLLNMGIVYLLVEKVHVWYLLAQVAASGILAVGSFFIYKYVIFERQP